MVNFSIKKHLKRKLRHAFLFFSCLYSFTMLGANPIPSAQLYGYASTKVIAQVKNAALAEVAATSFEDASAKGRWNFNISGTQLTAGGVSFTGAKEYSLVHGSITYTLPQASGKMLVVSYWRRSGSQTVNGTAGVPGRIAVIAGQTWTQYRHILNNPISVTVSGLGVIDELRLHPVNAVITSYTYFQDVGLATQCDALGNVVYFEYDAFNRVVVQRDADYRVIKRHCYGRVGEFHECTGTIYYNEVKSATLARNDCPAGFTAGNATYIIPAGTYYSYASQPHANQLADDALESHKQAFANINGACNTMFQSADYSGIYFSALCQFPAAPLPIYVSVPQGQFTSFISQQDANLQAQNYAQQYANTNGICASQVNLTYNNNSWGNYITIILENFSTYEQFYFEITSSGSGILGTVPQGDYLVSFNSMNDINVTTSCLSASGNGFSFSLSPAPVSINSNCNTFNISQ
jgi:hypothetical protein